MRIRKSLLIFGFCSASCTYIKLRESKPEAVARVNDTYLYKSDINTIIPKNTSAKDSLILVENYIKEWALQQLLLQKAELNLAKDERFEIIEKQVADYRKSLLIYLYQKGFVEQKLDTSISDKDIQDYLGLVPGLKNNNQKTALSGDEQPAGTLKNPDAADWEKTKNFILLKRKQRLVGEMEESIYKEALADNNIEIF